MAADATESLVTIYVQQKFGVAQALFTNGQSFTGTVPALVHLLEKGGYTLADIVLVDLNGGFDRDELSRQAQALTDALLSSRMPDPAFGGTARSRYTT